MIKKLIIAIFVFIILLFLFNGMAFAVDINEQVSTGTDDGYRGGAGIFSRTGNTIFIGNQDFLGTPTIYDSFYRFPAVTIPDGAIIDVAYITLNGNGAGAGSPKTKISADDQANPSAPTTNGDHQGRVRTTAGVDWDASLPTSDTNSPSIVSVIEELMASYSYSGGAAIMILHDDDSSANGSYMNPDVVESDATDAAKLHIEYTSADVTRKVSIKGVNLIIKGANLIIK